MSQQRSPEQDHRFSPYLSPAVHQLQPVQRPSSMNHSHLTDQRKSSPIFASIHSHPPSNGAVGATSPIKIPNAVQNLRRLKNPSTASLATTIHSEQHPSPRNVQTPPFRQIASSSTLPPPLSTPLNISTPAPTTTADDGNGLSKADRDIFRVNHHVPVTQPTATRAVDGSRGAIQDGNAESFKQVPMQPEAPPFVTSKEQKEKKDKKEDKEQRRKARQAKKVAKGEESPEERAKRKAEKKARKEAREEKRNAVGDSAHMGQESVISSGLSLATLSHLNETYPQSAFHSENGCVLPDSLSVRSKPVDHQSAPGKMGDTSQTRNFPLAFSDSTENPPALLAPRTETLVKPTQDELCEHPERKTHKRDKKAQLEASDGSHERKKNHHKTKKSTPGQEPGTTTALVTTNASRSPTLSSSPPQHKLGQPYSTIPNPQAMIVHQPSPPAHYTPYVSNQHSYSRPSMNYEPQHRPSTDSRPNSKPRVQSTMKQGSYTYLSLAQNDAVATDYSHDYREQTSDTLNSLHGDKHVGVQSENDRCCGWLFGGTNNKYHRYSEVKATGNQGTRGKKARKQVSDEDSDDDCVVM